MTVQDGESPHVYWQMGDHGQWYRLDADANTCTCLDWVHRRAATRSACKHLTRLAAVLAGVKKGTVPVEPIPVNELVQL